MGRLICISFIAAVFSFLAAAPASATPYMSWGQWTSDPGVPFSQCTDRAPRALQAVGVTPNQNGRFFDGWNDAFIASVICYDLGNGRFMVTIEVAQDGGNAESTGGVRDRIAGIIFGSGGGTAPPPTGAAPGGMGWSATATDFRGRNGERFTFSCPSGGHE